MYNESHSVVSNSLQPMEFSRPELLEWVAFPFSGGSSQPRDQTQVSRIKGGFFFLPAEPQGKPKNTGVGSLSLLQQIFPTQESGSPQEAGVSFIAGGFSTNWAIRELSAHTYNI